MRAGDLCLDDSRLGPAGDDAFTYVEKEDGNSASHWAVLYANPPGATVSSVTDTTRHPLCDGQATGKVIKCDGQSGNGFAVGDDDAEARNPNATAWNSTKQVLSFWYKGGMSAVYVPVSSSLGTRYVTYHSYSGTDSVSTNYVNVFLGSTAGGTTWRRFERDIKADFERVVGGGATWTNTDGILIRPDAYLGYDFYVDDIRLSACKTVIQNSLTGGAIGQICSAREVTGTGGNGSLGLTDTWYHYDHIGNVANFSNSSGALVSGSIQHQDAWGYVLTSAATGVWATFSGRHLTTKEHDSDAGLYYFWQRWYDPAAGRFISTDPLMELSPYRYCLNNPLRLVDPSGLDTWDDLNDCVQTCAKAVIGSWKQCSDWMDKAADKLCTKVFGSPPPPSCLLAAKGIFTALGKLPLGLIGLSVNGACDILCGILIPGATPAY